VNAISATIILITAANTVLIIPEATQKQFGMLESMSRKSNFLKQGLPTGGRIYA